MNKEQLMLLKECVASLKNNNLSITLDSLAFEMINDGYSHWTYLDELAHRLVNKEIVTPLSDSEITNAIDLFINYKSNYM